MPKVKAVKDKIVEKKSRQVSDARAAAMSAPIKTAHEEVLEGGSQGTQNHTPNEGTEEVAEKDTEQASPSFRRPGRDELNNRQEIRFFGSELLRARFPKPFEVADEVAEEWVKGGDFSLKSIENPFAKDLVKKGLAKAKELEKKVLESPHTEKIVTRAFEIGLEVNQRVNDFKQKWGRK